MELVSVSLHNPMQIKVNTEDVDYLDDMREHFTEHVEGFQYMPAYRSGSWNGKTCMMHKFNNTLPYGLLFELMKAHKKYFPRHKLTVDREVKSLFNGPKFIPRYNLSLYPRNYQKESIRACLKYTKGIIRSATACHAKGDKIILSSGKVKNIEDIKTGDYVIGKYGKPKKVLDIFCGVDDLYKIIPKNKRSPITVTKNHLLHLTFTNRGGKYNKKWNTLENISVEDYLNKSKYYKDLSKLAYSKSEIEFNYIETDCNLSPYFIGLYLGDGHADGCAVTSADKECVNEIKKESKKFNMVIKEYPYAKYSYFIRGSKNRRNIILNEFDKIGLRFGLVKKKTKCADKFIPKIIFNQDIDYRKEVLAGLMDSDGYLGSHRTSYGITLKSKKLRDGTALLSTSLGLVCSKSIKIVNNVKYYRLRIMGDISKIPVRLPRKRNIKKSSTDAYKSGFEIEYYGKGDFYGIQVEDSLYLMDGGMVTHNSGKSLVISYIVKTLLDRDKSGVDNAIIIVPTISLVEQFYGDMIEYGISEKLIGRVHGKSKQWDKPITISTWQTLKNNHDQLINYNCVIVDEVHQSKAYQLKRILVKSVRAKYRLGFTGTLHSGVLDNWNTKSYLGPVLKEYPSGLLADKGFISKCNVNVLNLEYKGEPYEGTYDEVKDEVFTNQFRITLINNLIDRLDHNILLLVGKVEKEGDYLKDILNTDKEVVFLSGRDSVELREEWREKMKDRKDVALIATYGIFQQGINIPNLKYIILASPFKSKIRVLQSIGRALRSHADKENGAYIFDLHDHTTFFEKHGDVRYRYYDSEKFHISEYLFEEGDSIDVNKIEIT